MSVLMPSRVDVPQTTISLAEAWLWLGRGGLAIADQGLVGVSNFALNILLARWLPPRAYGAYALAFATFLLLASLHSALLLEPMSVLGSDRQGERRRVYLGALVWLHFALTLPLAAIILVVAVYYGRGGDAGTSFAGMAIAAPCVLLFWLVRAAVYLDLSPGPAARGAALYSMLLLGGLAVFFRQRMLTAFSAFLLMAAGAAFLSAFLLMHSKPLLRRGAREIRAVWMEHWQYGRWELGTGGVSWMAENAAYYSTGLFLGIGEVAALRALANVFLPVPHVSVALRRVLQPYISGISARLGPAAVRAPVARTVLLFAGAGLLYCLAASAWGRPLMHALYGLRFAEFSYLIPGVAAAVALSTGSQAFGMALRALRAPSGVFKANCASAAVSALATFPAAWLFGLRGVVVAGVLTNITMLLATAFLYRRRLGPAALDPERGLA